MASAKKMMLLGQEMNRLLWLASAAIAFGFFLIGYGFWNWRTIQLQQDRLLKMELKNTHDSRHPTA